MRIVEGRKEVLFLNFFQNKLELEGFEKEPTSYFKKDLLLVSEFESEKYEPAYNEDGLTLPEKIYKHRLGMKNGDLN